MRLPLWGFFRRRKKCIAWTSSLEWTLPMRNISGQSPIPWHTLPLCTGSDAKKHSADCCREGGVGREGARRRVVEEKGAIVVWRRRDGVSTRTTRYGEDAPQIMATLRFELQMAESALPPRAAWGSHASVAGGLNPHCTRPWPSSVGCPSAVRAARLRNGGDI